MKNSKHSWTTELRPRAIELLILVAEHTERTGDAITRYFVPKAKPMWSDTLRRSVDVSGSGDASSLRALARRGLIEPVRNGADYCFAATADGQCVARVFAAMPAYGGK